MNLGFVSSDDWKEELEFAAECGFDNLEITVDYDHSLDLDRMSRDDILTVRKTFEGKGVSIATVCTSLNLLDRNPDRRNRNIDYIQRMIRTVKEFGTDIITTNVWGNRDLKPIDNVPVFAEVYTAVAKLAEEEGVRIAFENCPHYSVYPYHIGNIGYSPEMWKLLFDAVPSPSLGLEFDPSHLVWMGIDYIEALKNFSHRVYAVHAKDTIIFEDKKKECGVLPKQTGIDFDGDFGWWKHRIPGHGMIDWKAIYNVLKENHFTGPVIIEHEDPVYYDDLRPEGLRLGLAYLRSLEASNQ